MAKNLSLSLILAHLAKICTPKFFPWVSPLLDVRHFASYHFIQYQGKAMIQTQENGKKPHFGPDLGQLLDLNSVPKIFL